MRDYLGVVATAGTGGRNRVAVEDCCTNTRGSSSLAALGLLDAIPVLQNEMQPFPSFPSFPSVQIPFGTESFCRPRQDQVFARLAAAMK